MISFDVVGAPAPQGSKKAFVVKTKMGPRAVVTEQSKGVKPWRALIAEAAGPHVPTKPLLGPLAVTVSFRMPVPKSAPKSRRLWATKRPDIDKLVRAALDALTGIIWHDDSQIVALEVHKMLAYDAPIGCSIEIVEIGAA